MKFEYDDGRPVSECVAFIDDEGDLCIRSSDNKGVYLIADGEVVGGLHFEEYMCINEVVRKFYPGDKITITF